MMMEEKHTVQSGADIEQILQIAGREDVSDIHMIPGSPLLHRIDGKLVIADPAPVTEESVRAFMEAVFLSEDLRKKLEEEKELVFAFSAHENLRLRAAVSVQQGTYAATFRVIPPRIPSPQDLELPSAVRSLMEYPKGLILIAGSSGSGKTTLRAGMVNGIAEKELRHITVLERPVEYLFSNTKSPVVQREIGRDVRSYAAGIHAAMQQDADLISVGELTDAETVESVLRAADMGHLICAEVPAGSAEMAVRAIMELFPEHRQQQIRIRLADVLRGVISKQLLPCMDGAGRCAVYEVLLADKETRRLICEGDFSLLASVMERGAEHGMQTMDQAIFTAYMKSRISAETAVSYANDTEHMQKMIQI